MSAIYKRGHRPAAVEVTTRRGRFIKDVPYPTGDPKNPMPWGQVVKKFFPMAATVIGKEKAERCIARIETLEEMKHVAELAELIAG